MTLETVPVFVRHDIPVSSSHGRECDITIDYWLPEDYAVQGLVESVSASNAGVTSSRWQSEYGGSLYTYRTV